jgi:poly [ADP-ribose] polymerase
MHVLAIDRFEEISRFNKNLGNRKFLFHGSRVTNWVSILSQGLRIAPPEAPSTGYMFGKGVYFADVASKSANYCFATPDQPYGVLALCDVALGTPLVKLEADYDASELALTQGCHSTWGVGQSAPSHEEEVEEQILAPIGKLVPNEDALLKAKTLLPKEKPTLLYNEFVVYNLAQLRLKYLVFLRFNFESERSGESYW